MVTNRDRNSFGLRQKNPKIAQTTGTIDVFDLHSAFRDPLRGELPHVQIFMMDSTRSHEMPSCSAIDLAEIQQSSKSSSCI